MTDLLWLVPALPLAGAVVNLAAGRRLGRRAGWIAVAAMVAAAEVVVGLAIIVSVYRRRRSADIDDANLLRW